MIILQSSIYEKYGSSAEMKLPVQEIAGEGPPVAHVFLKNITYPMNHGTRQLFDHTTIILTAVFKPLITRCSSKRTFLINI